MKAVPEYLVNHTALVDSIAPLFGETHSPLNAPATDRPAIAALAARHGISPLLYHALIQSGLSSSVPSELLQSLREAYLMNGTRNALLYHDLGQVLTALQQNGIPVIVLKGAYLAALVYENPSLRKMNDIDVLVRHTDLEKTQSILRGLGYISDHTYSTTPPERDHHLPRMHKGSGPCIEVHWAIVSPGVPFKIDDEGLWQRAQPITIAGIATQALSHEDLLLHLCVHATSHYSERFSITHAPFCLGLRPLCDMAAVVHRHHGDINWQELQSRATQWRAGKCLFMSLWLVKKLLGANVPNAVLRSLQPSNFDARWAELACEQVALAGVESNVPDAVKSVLIPFMKSGEQRGTAKGNGKKHWLRLLIQTAFPSREFMAEYMAKHHAVSLNPIRRYTCYFTRAIDWFPKGIRLAWHFIRNRRQAGFYARQFQQPLLWEWLTDNLD